MTPREAAGCTLTQIVAMLGRADGSDPHAGGAPIRSTDELDEMWDELFEG